MMAMQERETAMARGGRTLVRMVVAGLLMLAALALFVPATAQAHVHSGAHGQAHAASVAPAPVDGVWVGDADHAPPADDACAGKTGLACGGACPMMLSGIAAAAPFPLPPLRLAAPFRPPGLLPEGIGTLPALKPPRVFV